MKAFKRVLAGGAGLVAIALLAACETTDSGSTATAYYGVGFYDPWYYGDAYHDDGVVVSPPGDRPRPEHPIALPPGGGNRPATTPSIPSTPRPAPRGGRR
jgi:hypothetical protein